MKTVSVINYKGGVGKTTLVANIAANLATEGYKVLCIDLDPQTNLTFSFITVDNWQKKYQKSKTIKKWYDAFLDDESDFNISDLIITPERVNKDITGTGKVDLICSHLGLINIDLELATKLGGASPRQSRKNYLRVYSRLKNGLNNMEESPYDFVLIDCPPNFNIVTRNALVASDAYMIPAKPDYLSTLGIDQLQKHVDELIKDYNMYVSDTVEGSDEDEWDLLGPEMIGVVFTMLFIRSNAPISAQQAFINQVKRLSIPTFDTMIRENKTIYADAPQYGVPVVTQSVSGKTYIDVKSELKNLTNEFLSKM
ncbi:chromosome partitioning protein [Methanolobus vulcani]|uniref:Chromosome partitioning protein n=1 Tax=Methanolobus vulcani TaxID=38026 RepID=A0A7Z7FC09_9EURY|nr:AAA family ATPase [Methanolobus vulcani]SDF46779.1 chromosome partitioning protein [Methanolobus vulcani]